MVKGAISHPWKIQKTDLWYLNSSQKRAQHTRWTTLFFFLSHEGSITYTDEGSHLSETKTELKWEPEPKLVDFFGRLKKIHQKCFILWKNHFFSRNCRSKVWVFSGPCVQTMRLAKLTYVLDMPATGIVWKRRQSWFGHASNRWCRASSPSGFHGLAGPSCQTRTSSSTLWQVSIVWYARYLATCVLALRAYSIGILKVSKTQVVLGSTFWLASARNPSAWALEHPSMAGGRSKAALATSPQQLSPRIPPCCPWTTRAAAHQ